jgi:Uma2 family endonuclease
MTIVRDPLLEEELRAARKRSGADRYDEVWDGVTVMSPLADNEHQVLAMRLGTLIQMALGLDSPHLVMAGTNVTDRRDDWRKNFRCPDVAVYLEGTAAENRGTHWFGGPDLAVEIGSEHASPDDATREKIPFYAGVGTRELLIIDRDPWALELLRLDGDQLVPAGRSTLDDPRTIASAVVPLTFRLEPGTPRPRLVVAQPDAGRAWTA